MRLQSFLSQAGISSRRNVIQELEAGKVKVNGEVVRIPSYPIFPDKDEVTYLDQRVTLSRSKLYFIFNKPRGVITTAKDTHGRKTVLDYFKDVKARLYPVGRLDQDTTGLLLLTNNGDLANKLMHPRYGVEKVYEALLNQEAMKEQIQQLEQGVIIEGEKTAPCTFSEKNVKFFPNTFGEERQVLPEKCSRKGARRSTRAKSARCKIKVLNAQDGKSKVEIALHEGKKRQIRYMFQSIGIRVLDLHRKKYGPLDLKGLTPGKKRALTNAEIQLLKNAISSRK